VNDQDRPAWAVPGGPVFVETSTGFLRRTILKVTATSVVVSHPSAADGERFTRRGSGYARTVKGSRWSSLILVAPDDSRALRWFDGQARDYAVCAAKEALTAWCRKPTPEHAAIARGAVAALDQWLTSTTGEGR
jgi:hypothetical protein